MNKSFLILMLILTAGIANAQNANSSDVPELVKAQFASQYPNCHAEQWKVVNGNYETKFTSADSKMCVVIDPSGNVVRTSTVIKSSELPKPAIDYVAKNDAGQKIKEACKTIEADGKIKYEAVVKDNRLCFDSAGGFLKSEKCKK